VRRNVSARASHLRLTRARIARLATDPLHQICFASGIRATSNRTSVS
jgi:hypothetical protein